MNNLVAKHAKTFNKAHVMDDRKKTAKVNSQRKMKHKNKELS